MVALENTGVTIEYMLNIMANNSDIYIHEHDNFSIAVVVAALSFPCFLMTATVVSMYNLINEEERNDALTV